MNKIKLSPVFVGFLQALALVIYTGIIGSVLLNGNKWFGPKPNFLGPTLFLILICFSAMYCAAVMGAYPFWVFWEKKDTKLAYKIVISSAVWLLAFIILVISLLLLVK